MEIVTVDKVKVLNILQARGIVCIVGLYGSGKKLIANWIEKEFAKTGKVERISYKDLMITNEKDIYNIAGYESWEKMESAWRQSVEKARKKSGKFTLIIEEAQRILENGEELWQILANLCNEKHESFQLVLLAQPALLGPVSLTLKRIIKGKVLYTRKLNVNEIDKLIGEVKYRKAIARLSARHYGTVKYLIQLVEKENPSTPRLTEAQIIKWASKRGDMPYFAQIIWEGLNVRQKWTVRKYIASKGQVELRDRGVIELLAVGMLRLGGRQVKWFVPWTLEFVKNFLISQPVGYKDIEVDFINGLGTKQGRLIRVMLQNAGQEVDYAELAESIWGVDNEEFSLWALSRLVGRINRKLELAGYPQRIMNERGLGYRLVK